MVLFLKFILYCYYCACLVFGFACRLVCLVTGYFTWIRLMVSSLINFGQC